MKVGNYDERKLGGQVYFIASVTGNNLVTTKNEKHEVGTVSLRPKKGLTMKGLKADGLIRVVIPGIGGRGFEGLGAKVVVTVARGTFIDVPPILFWIYFFVIISASVLLFFIAIGLFIFIIKKLKE